MIWEVQQPWFKLKDSLKELDEKIKNVDMTGSDAYTILAKLYLEKGEKEETYKILDGIVHRYYNTKHWEEFLKDGQDGWQRVVLSSLCDEKSIGQVMLKKLTEEFDIYSDVESKELNIDGEFVKFKVEEGYHGYPTLFDDKGRIWDNYTVPRIEDMSMMKGMKLFIPKIKKRPSFYRVPILRT